MVSVLQLRKWMQHCPRSRHAGKLGFPCVARKTLCPVAVVRMHEPLTAITLRQHDARFSVYLLSLRHLALSTNSIEKISSLSGMNNLRILSLGRNLLKKIENVEVVAETLEELWLSYNQIEKLVSCLYKADQL